jgi:hypothetical protein
VPGRWRTPVRLRAVEQLQASPKLNMKVLEEITP